MSGTKITIKAQVEAPVDKVWRCWTEPQHITRWNFASDDWCCPSAENDLRVGGSYRARMEARDQSFGFDFVAIYDEIVENETIAYTMEDGRQAVTTFDGRGDSTVVTTVFDAETSHPEDVQKNGWQSILDNFTRYVEAQ